MIFDYFSIPETTSLPPVDFTDATVVPLWRDDLDVELGPQPSSISRPFFCSHSIRFSLRGKDDIYGVIIDYPYNEGPTKPLAQVVKLRERLDVSMKPHECYGYNKAAILCGGFGTYLFHYPWPDEQNDGQWPVSLHAEDSFQICDFGPLLDEQSGRLVVSIDVTPLNHGIWDFSLHKQLPTV